MARGSISPPVRHYNLRSHTHRHLQIFNPPLELCGEFHLFARFPADIRWLVWQQALSHERWIDITLNRFDYTHTPHFKQKLANPSEYNIVLDNRWRISKLFRTTPESRRAALAFYRVQLPCWQQGEDKIMSRGTLYVCPELDHLSLDSLEYFERFAHDLWTCDPRHIGLVNLALRAKCPRYSIKTPIIQHNEVSVLRQGLSRIERLTMMNYRGSKKLWGGLRPGSNPICRMNHVVPIRSGVQSFNRLPYDPRLHGEDLKRVFLGSWGPRHSFNHWFKLLSKLRVQHEHKVIYQFGSCRGATSGYGDHYFPTISDRESATEWLRYDNDELRERFERNNRLPDLKGQICHKITRLFEESPQPVVGFWLFPMESVLTPDDPNIHDTDTPPADPKIVNMSKNMPELCLGNIF